MSMLGVNWLLFRPFGLWNGKGYSCRSVGGHTAYTPQGGSNGNFGLDGNVPVGSRFEVFHRDGAARERYVGIAFDNFVADSEVVNTVNRSQVPNAVASAFSLAEPLVASLTVV